MNMTDWILIAVLTGITIHFYFRKKKTTVSPEKKKEHPVEQAIRNEKQEKNCPIIRIVFQPELEDEELAAEIADMYLHGRAYYYTGKPMPEQSNESPISIKYKDVQWDKLKSIHV